MKILVLFVEPMLYITDLIHEVYEKTPYEYQYIFCDERLTGRDALELPANTVVCSGTPQQRKGQIKAVFEAFAPDFAVINGYVGIEQRVAIGCCRENSIPYAIETDTPLHVPGNKLKAAAKRLYLRWLLGNPLCYGFPGGTLQKENLVYYGIPESKCFVMPMCVSADRLLAEHKKLAGKEELKAQHGLDGKNVFLFVGRLEPVKNIPVLLRAFGEFKRNDPNAALLIVGDGSEADSLKQMADHENIQDVRFEGYVVFPKLVMYYKMADVFVLPSCYEPWGLVVNEAQILGLPVVVSSHVGCRKDLVLAGKNGYIFENDNAAELRDAMQCALRLDPTGNQITEEWNFDKYLSVFVSAVEKICEKQTK